ncbi:MAG: Hsp20/alpha crystallin family protein [Deltaproteobacteria bacterium]|nr:Hsp20/alpha crystallin family protein [Deltaproteobacteria bacterium]
MTTKRKTAGKKPDEDRGDIGGGIFSSLTGFINNLGDLAETGERLSQRKASNQDTGGKGRAGEKAGGENRFGRILSGLTDIAEKLNEISETGETVTKKGEFTFPSKEGGVKGVYGFSLKTGLGGKDDAIKVEPFGNIRKDKKTGEAVVQEIHEPLIDVFEDEDATTLIAEMPGVGTGDIKIDVRDDVLTISADKGEKKYRKEVLLSHSPAKDRIKVTCNNGIVTIRCEKAG